MESLRSRGIELQKVLKIMLVAYTSGHRQKGFFAISVIIQRVLVVVRASSLTKMTRTKFDIEKFDGENDFALWKVRMKAFLKQQGLAAALKELPAATMAAYDNSEHIDEFHKRVGDLAAIDTAISDEDLTLLLLTSLPLSYNNLLETLLYGGDTLKLEDVLAALNSMELQKMTKATGDGGEGLYVRGRSGQRDMEQGTDNAYNHKKSQGLSGMKIRECRVHRTSKVQVQMRDGSSFVWDNVRYVPELRRNLISVGTLEKEGFTVMMQSSKIKVVTRKTLKGRKQVGEYQTGWKIKMGNVLDSCNQRSTQKCMKSGVVKHLDVAGIQQQNELVEETNMTLLAKLRCFLIQSGLFKVFWAEDTTMSTYLVNRSPSSAIGFKTPVDMLGFFCWLASIKEGMLEPVKFEAEPQEDHAFEVEPHGNVDHVAGSQKVQTQKFIYYHLVRDREKHSTHEIFNYREDNNEVSFAVVEAKRIYAHESLTFNNTVTYDVISKWKARLNYNIDARSDVYVFRNGCKKYSDDNDVYYSEYTPGMFIHLFLYIDDMVFLADARLKSWLPRVCWIKQREMHLTFLERHFILSLEGSLSKDCDVEKNASTDVAMLDKFDRVLQTDVQVFVDFDYTMGRSITAMGRSITRYGLMIQGDGGGVIDAVFIGLLYEVLQLPRQST
nr:hypothetical protein [Tanacetum cinerariifolium]